MPLYVSMIIEGFILYVIFANVRNSKFSFIAAAVIILCRVFSSGLFSNYIDSFDIAAILVNILSIVVLTAIAAIKTKQFRFSVAYAFTATIILILSAHLASMIVSLAHLIVPNFIGLGRDAIMNYWLLAFMYGCIMFALGFTISFYLGRTFHARLQHLDDPLKKKVFVYMLVGAIITLGLFFINTFLHDMLTEEALLSPIYALSLSGFFIYYVVIKLAYMEGLRKEIELRHQEELLLSSQEYTSQIEEMSKGLRAFHHDHTNLMLTFRTYIEEKDLDGLTSFYKKYTDEFSNTSIPMNKCLDGLANIQTQEIKNLFLTKFMHAHRLGIDIRIEAMDSAAITDVNTVFDTCRLIGIYMDNAIEACQDVEGAQIQLIATKDDDVSQFIIVNTCATLPPLNKIYKKGFSSKGESRGMGLHIASQILSKNSNIVAKTNLKNEEFIQELNVFG